MLRETMLHSLISDRTRQPLELQARPHGRASLSAYSGCAVDDERLVLP